jgi:hypothetical protein
MNEYCRLFGYSSCENLNIYEKFLLIAVATIGFIIIVGILRRMVTGISH